MFLRLFLALLFGLAPWPYVQAQPLNDACARAFPLSIGETLRNQDNRLASIAEAETPAIAPATCIKTYENDLWYTFTTEASYSHYRITVEAYECETPAGLQLLVIQTDTCDPTTYDYTLCVNPQSMQTLEAFWESELAGQTYLVQVDGFDGNICGFQITLEGYDGDPRTLGDLRRMTVDHDRLEPDYKEAELQSTFQNNALTLRWRADTREEIRFFLVERVPFGEDEMGIRNVSLSGYVKAVIDPINTVGSGQMQEYVYTLEQPFVEGEKYCYQVVKVLSDRSRHYSEPSCIQAQLIKDFFVSDVYASDSTGTYAIKFINRKRQNLVFSLYDQAGTYLKGYTRQREPLRDGEVTIDMRDYEPGFYLLTVEGKRGTYRREFWVE